MPLKWINSSRTSVEAGRLLLSHPGTRWCWLGPGLREGIREGRWIGNLLKVRVIRRMDAFDGLN